MKLTWEEKRDGSGVGGGASVEGYQHYLSIVYHMYMEGKCRSNLEMLHLQIQVYNIYWWLWMLVKTLDRGVWRLEQFDNGEKEKWQGATRVPMMEKLVSLKKDP